MYHKTLSHHSSQMVCGVLALTVCLVLSRQVHCAAAELNDISADRVAVRGLVTDDANRPVAGASVSAVMLSHYPPTDPRAGSTAAIEIGRVTANAQRLTLHLRRATDQDIALELSATAAGFGPALFDPGVTEIHHQVSLKLPEAAQLRLKVLAPSGEPLPRASLKLCRLLTHIEGTDAPA